MKCDLILLEDYVEGFLNEMEKKKVEAHLQSCAKCKLEYDQFIMEQNALLTQLNQPRKANSQSDTIMQRIQTNTKRKKSWQTLKMTIISAAVIMLSFTLFYWNRTPNELAQPSDKPTQLIETNSSEQGENSEGELSLGYNEPFLDVSIDQVVENGENYDIHFRVKLKEQYQQEQNNLYEQLLTKYQRVEVANLPKIEDGQDDFFGHVSTGVQFAVRDETGKLILATTKTKDGEQPLINNYSTGGFGTKLLGERIYTTSVPKYTNPSTIEVLQMEAYVFDLFETEINTAQLQPFQLNNATYAIDSIEIQNGIMYLKISTEGEPEKMPSSWDIKLDDRLIRANHGTTDVINGRTVYTLQFENFDQIPTNFKLVPVTVKVTKRIDPIILDLN